MTMSRRSVVLFVAASIVIALALRVAALGFGLPDVHHPDEIPILNRALAFAKGDPNPHNFLYPTLYFYALFAWEVLFYAAGHLAGMYSSVADFQREFFTNPTHAVLAGRALTATFGVLTIPAVYRFGARLYGPGVGAGAALFLAVAPFAVRDAHYIKHDVPAAFFVTLTFVALSRIVADPEAAERRSSWALAGAMAGLAMSTHYYAIFIVVPFVAVTAACIWRTRNWRRSFVLLVWSGVASVATFFAASPFMLIEPRTVVRDLVGVREVDIDRAVTGKGMFLTIGPYLRMLATDALGWPVGLAGGLGLVVASVRDWRRGLMMLSFVGAFLAFCSNTVPMSRYLNVTLPVFAVAAAYLLTEVAAVFGRRSIVAAAVLFILASIPGLAISIRSDVFYGQADTRTLAKEFIERHVPSGSSILIQPHGVNLRPSRENLIEALDANLGSAERATVKYRIQLSLTPYPSPAYRLIYLGEKGEDPDKIYLSPHAFGADTGLHPLRALRVQYAVMKRYNIEDPALATLQAALVREARLIARFSPYAAGVGTDRRAAVTPFFHNTAARIDPALERPGPVVEIWRID